MSQDAYPMPSVDQIKSFRAMRLANLHALVAEVAPGNERAEKALARLEAITCDYFWQDSHFEDDKSLLRGAAQPGTLRCRATASQPQAHTH